MQIAGCVRCLEQPGLEEVLAALERYCFMGAGDWADTLVQLMGTANLSVEPTTPHDLHRMLDTAVLVRCPQTTSALLPAPQPSLLAMSG